jgi:hypothetical protein
LLPLIDRAFFVNQFSLGQEHRGQFVDLSGIERGYRLLLALSNGCNGRILLHLALDDTHRFDDEEHAHDH